MTETNHVDDFALVQKHNRRRSFSEGAGKTLPVERFYEFAFSTVTARRFCDQQEMSLQTATGRSLP